MEAHCGADHGCALTAVMPLHKDKYDMATDLFVVGPKEDTNLIRKFQKQVMQRANKLIVRKRKFQPDEIDALPKHQVFADERGSDADDDDDNDDDSYDYDLKHFKDANYREYVLGPFRP